MSFDVVIPCGPNDDQIILTNLEHNSKNIIGLNKIYVIAHLPENIILPEHLVSNVIIVSENEAPFTKKECTEALDSNTTRVGWYFQQLIKLYAHEIIEGLTDYYLVIDADTFFIKPTYFFDDVPLYNVSNQYHQPYFYHMQKLLNIEKQVKHSGITHHMIFSRQILSEMMSSSKNGDIPFWQLFLKSIDENHIEGAGASEYELYFNYLHKHHPDKFKIRKLPFKDISRNIALPNIQKFNKNHYISLHYWLSPH